MVGGSCVAKEVDDGMSDMHSELSAFGFLDRDQMSKNGFLLFNTGALIDRYRIPWFVYQNFVLALVRINARLVVTDDTIMIKALKVL